MTAQAVARDGVNPLDQVEEVLSGNNWTFNRMNNDELMVQVKGKACSYRLFFIWQETLGALQFCCQYDLSLSDINIPLAAGVLMDMNEGLWMGHFEIAKVGRIPSFRQTSLLASSDHAGCDHISDLVGFSLAQCEQYFPVFHMLSQPEMANAQAITLALMETVGES